MTVYTSPTPKADLSTVRIYVPTRGHVSWLTATQLQTIRDANPGLPAIRYQPGRHSVVVTRNAVRQVFLEDADAEVCVMVDDDVVPHPEFLNALDALDRFGIIGWPVPLVGQFEMVWNTTWDAGQPTHHGVTPVERVGGGVMVVRRDVLERVEFREGDLELWNGEAHQCPPEDWLFCDEARALGFEVGLDTRRIADHFPPTSAAHLMKIFGPQARAQMWRPPVTRVAPRDTGHP